MAVPINVATQRDVADYVLDFLNLRVKTMVGDILKLLDQHINILSDEMINKSECIFSYVFRYI